MKYLIFLLSFSMFAQTFEGKVVNQECYEHDGNIYTKNIVESPSKKQIELITKGGVIGLRADVVSDVPVLYRGQKAKFYYNNKKEVYKVEGIYNASSSTFNITPINIAAGNKEVLTITGQAFGTEKGTVQFPNADTGGATYITALDSQVSWSDNKISVEVPSNACTGIVKVVMPNDTIYESSEGLIVDFAITNLPYSGEEYYTQHTSQGTQGAYVWQFNSLFPQDYRDSFMKAFNEIRCNTGIDWEIGDDTAVSQPQGDDVNSITFSNDIGALGICYSRYSGCFQDGVVKWYVREFDIVFNGNQDWSLLSTPEFNKYNFQSVALHELGHGHQLGHVNNTSKLMHYSLATNTVKTVFGEHDLEAASIVQNRSLNTPVCAQDLAGYFECSLSIDDYVLDYDLGDVEYYTLLGQKINNLEYADQAVYLEVRTFLNKRKVTKIIKK